VGAVPCFITRNYVVWMAYKRACPFEIPINYFSDVL